MNGKGDTYRPTDKERFDTTYERVFGKPDPISCECINWAREWCAGDYSSILDHHPRCEHAENADKNAPE